MFVANEKTEVEWKSSEKFRQIGERISWLLGISKFKQAEGLRTLNQF